jgi:hypothetical protein
MTLGSGLGERVYRGLLRLYPAEFRDRFSGEMVQLFNDKLRDARAGSASLGTVRAWLTLLGDVAVTAPSEHLRRNRTVAHSLSSAPQISARALGIVGILAGIVGLAVFVIEIPQELFPPRIILMNLGFIAIVLAVHRRQAAVAPRLALLAAVPAVLANAWYLVMVVLQMLRTGPIFGGAFGLVAFWGGVALWLTTALFGAMTLRLGAVTRLGALATTVGALLTLTGIDRIGLVSEASPTIFNTLSQVGIITLAVGWILLGLDVAIRRAPQPSSS